MQILITGCARSGTSLTSQICGALGANLGAVSGLYENTPIRDEILKPMIKAAGGDPLGQYPLPAIDADPGIEMRGNVLSRLGRDGWAYKDAKIALVWRNWVREFPDAKWVIVRRDTEDIAASCVRAAFMRYYASHDEWRAWAQQYINRIEELKAEADYIEIWPYKAMSGNLTEFQRMAEHCGIDFDPAIVSESVDPKLWHH